MSLEEIQEQIERYYIEMENELLINIANKLAQGKPMEIDKWDLKTNSPIVGSGGVNEWQLERLKELGGLNEENAKIIAKYSGKTHEEVEKVFERARQIGTEIDEEILSLGIKAGILNEINPFIEEVTVKNILRNSINEVLTTFNKQNNSLLASAGNNYREIVNKVSSQVMAGTKTTGKAMQEAVSELAQNGLTGFTARNGAQWSPEAYTKMVIRSNTQNTINRIQEERMKLAGNDYVEISSHIGARPLCSEDQGKIFSLSDNITSIEDGLGHSIKVYAWSNSSYGEPAGILGINCGHSRYAFVPGISIHRKKEFTKKENDEAYIEKQQQRLYERTIRNKKREIAMLKETGAEQEYINSKMKQLRNYNKQYLNFLENTGRTRISANEWTGNIANIKVNKNKEKSKSFTLFNDNRITKDFSKLDKSVETMIIYNSKTKKQIYQFSNNSKNSVGDLKGYLIFATSLKNSIVTAHNHPTNTSFSVKDILTFNKFKSIDTLFVETNEYTYYLEKNGVNKINEKNLKKIVNDVKNIYYNNYGKTSKAIHLSNELIARKIGWKYGRIKK